MIKRSFFLLSTATFFFWGVNVSIASDSFNTHTQHTPIELKPVSLDNSYKTASVCFLGVGDCNDIGFNKGDDYGIDSANQCKNEGYVSSCPAGQKLNKDGRCPYNNAYGTCCTEKCPNGSSTSCSGSVVSDDGCGYSCKNCDPCPGYYDCGGTWQYCTGTTCYADASRCSVSCKSDYFPNKCNNKSDCKGVYRNGYCSGDCTPACVESCYGDSSPKIGEGWVSSPCTTCSGTTLYNNSAKSCPSGYSTSVDSCDASSGYRLATSGKSGDRVCGKCTTSSCPDGYDTSVTSCQTGYTLTTSGKSGGLTCNKCSNSNCPNGYDISVTSCSSANGYELETNGKSGETACGKCVAKACPSGYDTSITSCSSTNGYELETNGKSGGRACGKCIAKSCPSGYSTNTTSCATGYTLRTSGKSNGQACNKCECELTVTGSCFMATEATQSCVKNGTTYYKCESCHRKGGSAEGLVYCASFADSRYYKESPTKVVCGQVEYKESCGCEAALYKQGDCEKTRYADGYVDHTSYYYWGYAYMCYENNVMKGSQGCYRYNCSDPNYKVDDYGDNCCPIGNTDRSLCKRSRQYMFQP